MYVPRNYLYRYGYDGRDISIGQDLIDSFYHSREANLLDYYKYIDAMR